MSRDHDEGAFWGADQIDASAEKMEAYKLREALKAKEAFKCKVAQAIDLDGWIDCDLLNSYRVRGESYWWGDATPLDATRSGKYKVRAKLLDLSYFDL